jgi:hypothetical protein
LFFTEVAGKSGRGPVRLISRTVAAFTGGAPGTVTLTLLPRAAVVGKIVTGSCVESAPRRITDASASAIAYLLMCPPSIRIRRMIQENLS